VSSGFSVGMAGSLFRLGKDQLFATVTVEILPYNLIQRIGTLESIFWVFGIQQFRLRTIRL